MVFGGASFVVAGIGDLDCRGRRYTIRGLGGGYRGTDRLHRYQTASPWLVEVGQNEEARREPGREANYPER
jgi:hypothetical protein